jgi:hypothetical protein
VDDSSILTYHELDSNATFALLRILCWAIKPNMWQPEIERTIVKILSVQEVESKNPIDWSSTATVNLSNALNESTPPPSLDRESIAAQIYLVYSDTR